MFNTSIVITVFRCKTFYVKNVNIRKSTLSKHTYWRLIFVMETSGPPSFRPCSNYAGNTAEREPRTQAQAKGVCYS